MAVRSKKMKTIFEKAKIIFEKEFQKLLKRADSPFS
jgi:hypothetical protein